MEKFKQLLKSSRHSVTQARMAVFDELAARGPLSIKELSRRVGGIDRASVYRAVELFERLGIVQRVNMGWKYKLELTDKFAEHHHHLTCANCGRTIEINESELERIITRLAATHNFRPLSHQIEIQGLCDQCQSTRQSRANS